MWGPHLGAFLACWSGKKFLGEKVFVRVRGFVSKKRLMEAGAGFAPEWWVGLLPHSRAVAGRQLFDNLPLKRPRFTKEQKAAFKKKKCAAAAVAPCSNNGAGPGADTSAKPLRIGVFQQQRTNFLLHNAAAGNAAAVRAILQAGADVNAVNGYGQTAIFAAVWQNHIEVVRELLAFGADARIVTNSAGSCQGVARALGHSAELCRLVDDAVDGAKAVSPLGTDTDTDSEREAAGNELRASICHRTNGGVSTTTLSEASPLLSGENEVPPRANAAGPSSPLRSASCPVVLLRNAHGTVFHTTGSALLPVAIMRRLDAAFNACSEEVVPHGERHTDPLRKFFCDETGWVTAAICRALEISRVNHLPYDDNVGGILDDPSNLSSEEQPELGSAASFEVVPYMRFLCYNRPGQQLLPHIDSAKYGVPNTPAGSRRSTHTFIIFLSDSVACAEQQPEDSIMAIESPKDGATLFVEDVTTSPPRVLARCPPQRGRLLVFPHSQPHAGALTGARHKVLLRGELM